MKQQKTLLILVVALVVLLVVYLGATALTEDKTPAETTAETFALTDLDYSTATAMTYTMGDQTYELEVVNTIWYWSGDRNLPLNQTAIWQMVNAASNLTAQRTVDEGDPAEFGLDTPTNDIKISYSDGTESHLEIGDYNTFAKAYYLRMDGFIYLIDNTLPSYFTFTPYDMIQLDTLPAIADGAGAIKSVTTMLGALAEDKFEAVYSAYSAIVCNNLADYYADESELAAYGLDEASRSDITIAFTEKVEVTDTEGSISSSISKDHTVTLRIGGEAEGGYYLSFDDSAMVFVIPASTLDALIEACGIE